MSKKTRYHLNALLLLVLLGAATAADAQVEPQVAQRWFEEAKRLCERDAGRLWGVSVCAPMVIGDMRTQTFATSQPPPDAPLARLRFHDHARKTFFRASDVAFQSGAMNDAGMAALTTIEELSGHLTIEEIQTVYQRADTWLEASQHLPTLQRLRRAAGRVLEVRRQKEVSASTTDREPREYTSGDDATL